MGHHCCFLCGASACGSDDGGGGTPAPDANGDTGVDATVRVDVNTGSDGGSDGGLDAGADVVDSTNAPDAYDVAPEAANDRVVVDVPSDSDATSADAPGDVVNDVPITPPTAFTIVGVAGPMDTTPDAWLTGTPTPTVQWMGSAGAQGYEITVYGEDGTTVKCATQQQPGTATSASFPTCTLTEGLHYRASVVATAGTFRTTATNDKRRRRRYASFHRGPFQPARRDLPHRSHDHGGSGVALRRSARFGLQPPEQRRTDLGVVTNDS